MTYITKGEENNAILITLYKALFKKIGQNSIVSYVDSTWAPFFFVNKK